MSLVFIMECAPLGKSPVKRNSWWSQITRGTDRILCKVEAEAEETIASLHKTSSKIDSKSIQYSRRGLRRLLLRQGEKFFSPVALRSDSASWPPLTGLRDHNHWTHRTRYDSSGGVISPTQRPLPNNTQHSQQTDIHSCHRPDSNPQSQQASGRRPTP